MSITAKMFSATRTYLSIPTLSSQTRGKGYDQCATTAYKVYNRGIIITDLWRRKYLKAPENFMPGTMTKVAGSLKESLKLYRLHNSNHCHAWWMPKEELERLQSLDEFRALFAVWSKITHISYAEIPKGTYLKYYEGKACPKIDPATLKILPGGGRQFCLAFFDARWIKTTRRLYDKEREELGSAEV